MVVSGDVDAVTAVELQHAAIDVLRWQRPPFIDIDMAQVGFLTAPALAGAGCPLYLIVIGSQTGPTRCCTARCQAAAASWRPGRRQRGQPTQQAHRPPPDRRQVERADGDGGSGPALPEAARLTMKGPRLEAQRSRGPPVSWPARGGGPAPQGKRWAHAQVVPGRAECLTPGRLPMIRSPLWSSLMTAHDSTPVIVGYDPQRQAPAVTSTEAVDGGRLITRLPASGL